MHILSVFTNIAQKFKIMELKEYLDNFEEKLQQEILRLCKNYRFLDGTLLATDDIDNYWQVIAPEYLADAVEQVQDSRQSPWHGQHI